MAKDEAYFQRLEDLRHELIKGFFTVQVLKAFDSYENDEFDDEDDRYWLMLYLMESAKMDLAFVVCKVFDLKGQYYDKTKNRIIELNTIGNLNTFLCKKGYSFEKPFLSQASFRLYTKLRQIRNESLAHLNLNRELKEIKTEAMITCFNELVSMYNQRCIPELDERVQAFTMEETSDLPERVKHGLKLILEEFKIKTNEGNDNAGH